MTPVDLILTPILSRPRYSCQVLIYRERNVNSAQTWDMVTSPLAAIVKARRERTGLKQIPFAKAVGISQSKLNDIENGKTSPTNLRADTLLKLADYLKLHPRYLLTGRGPQEWSAADSEQEERLLSAFRELGPEARAEIVGRVEGMAASIVKPNRFNPHPGAPKPVSALPAPTKKTKQ